MAGVVRSPRRGRMAAPPEACRREAVFARSAGLQQLQGLVQSLEYTLRRSRQSRSRLKSLPDSRAARWERWFRPEIGLEASSRGHTPLPSTFRTTRNPTSSRLAVRSRLSRFADRQSCE